MNFFDGRQTIYAAGRSLAMGRPGKRYDLGLPVRISSRGRLIAFRTAVSGAEKGFVRLFRCYRVGGRH